MNDAVIQQLRIALMLQLLDASQGAPVTTLHIGVQALGYNVGQDELREQLDVLERKGWVSSQPLPSMKTIRHYRLNEAGARHLDEQGY